MKSQWKLFEKVTKHRNFVLLWDPKRPINWAFEAHIVHIYESSFNEHIKQDWCKSRGNFLTNYSKNLIFTDLDAKMAQKFGPLGPIFNIPTKVAPLSL